MLACIDEAVYIFFFSSGRRHTRFSRDWSSDVCSSDLSTRNCNDSLPKSARRPALSPPRKAEKAASTNFGGNQIGRASCRERESIMTVGEKIKSEVITPKRYKF